MIYTLKLAVKNITHDKLFTAILFICNTITILVITLFISESMGYNIHFSKNFNIQNDILVYEAAPDQEADKMLLNNDIDYSFDFYCSQNRIIINNDFVGGIHTNLIDENFDKMYGENFLTRGRFIVQADSECVIGERLASKYKLSLNKIITVGYIDFKICGITDIPQFESSIIMCDAHAINLGYPRQYFIDTKQQNYNDEIALQLKCLGGRMHIGNNNQDNNVIKYKLSDYRGTILMGLIFYVYLFFIVSILLYFNFEKSKQNFIVYKYLGATYTKLFFQIFIQMLIPTLFSSGLVFMVLLVTKDTISVARNSYIVVNLKLATIMILIAAVIPMIFSCISYRYMRKQIK